MILPGHQKEPGWKLEVRQLFSRPVFFCLLLFATTLLVYWPATKCDFINLDDPAYFTTNPHVLSGLTKDNVFWAFTTGDTGNWHPLTWLSLMLDVEIFGPNNPAGPHLTNVLFHGLNTILLFLLLVKLTGRNVPSACVAALFAWHPLHVESVAWVAERKDMLSTCCGLLAFLCYERYVKEKWRAGFWLALVFFGLSLLAKPMFVTMPFMLLLFDWWPLGRLSGYGVKTNWQPLLLEKIPFFVLSIISCVVTFLVQKKGGTVIALATFSISERLENVFVAYARYLGKTIWPLQLANPYPLVKHWDLLLVIFSVALVIGLSMVAIISARRFPYVFMGWFWFLGTLIPVIGLVQVGQQSMADRYTYLPLIGVFIIFAWSLSEICANRQAAKIPLVVLTGIILLAIVVQTRIQLGYWKNGETLFRRALAVTTDNYLAYEDLGNWLMKNGQVAEELDCFQKALDCYKKLGTRPNDPEIRYNLGNAFSRLGNWNEAIKNYEISLQLQPAQPDALDNLGFALAAEKQYTNAIACFVASLKLKPDSAEAHNNLASVLFIGHEFTAAEEQFREALRTDPDNSQVYVNLGDTLVRENKIAEAAQCYQTALQLKPDDEKTTLKLQALSK